MVTPVCVKRTKRRRFDRDRNTERKIRLNDESARQNSTRPIESARARPRARSRISPTQLRKRSLTPKAFKRIKFSRIVYDKMFPFNLSNHRRALQTFANLTGERD